MSTDLYTREDVLKLLAKGQSFENAKLKGIDLSKLDFRGADLRGAQFRYSDLRGADLRGADLRGANLRHVNLSGSNLCEADLRGTDFGHADIRGVNFTGARLKGAKFDGVRGLSVKVFIPQTVLDSLIGENKAELDGDEVKVAARNERWKLVPGARVIDLEAGKDRAKIMHKVLTEKQFADLGIEVYRDTALMDDGDTVYKLDSGFVGEPLHDVIRIAPEKGATDESLTPVPPATDEEEQKKSDQELINDFLLKRLTTS